MPGITGIIRVDGQPAAVDAAVSKLHHSPSYRSARIQPTPSISLGVVYRKDAAHEYDWHDDAQAQVTIFVNGTMVCAEPTPHILCAVDVLHEYLAHGFERWGQFEGGFVAVIVDLRQERVFIVNDRLGGLPLYYASRPGVFAFSPEAKGVLVHDGFDVRLSPPGLVNFLSAGYCFGELTLFEGLSMLEPSTLLSVHLQTLAVDKRRLWRIVYEPTPELLRRRAAEDALAQAIITAHQVTLCDAPSHVAVLLSGGWDSRGMLAALQRIDCKANIAQSRGIRDDIPASDVFIARRLAEAFGIPFVFGAYNTDGFVENAARWCYLSELTTDNFGWFAEGAGFLSAFYDASTDVTLVGDEAWEWRGYVANEMETGAAVFPARPSFIIQKILGNAFANDADQLYSEAIASISRHCQNSDFIDRKDFFYLHGRIARFIFSLGYYKELSTPLRRPFLSNTVLEVVRRLHARHRIWKNLYISTLHRHFPSVMAIPVNSISSLPDWAFDIRQKEDLRHYIFGLLEFKRLEGGLLGQLLDRQRFQRLRDDFFAASASTVPRQDSWLTMLERNTRRVIAQSRWLSRRLHTLRNAAETH